MQFAVEDQVLRDVGSVDIRLSQIAVRNVNFRHG